MSADAYDTITAARLGRAEPGGSRGSEAVAAAVPGLIAGLLSGRQARTERAYVGDLEEFARWQRCEQLEAIARLLAGGRECAQELVLRFVADLRRQGRAPATIGRRLGTLRLLVRLAQDQDLIDWRLDVQDWAAMSEHLDEGLGDDVAYVLPRHPAEVDRLDLQHYVLEEALGGLYLAPVGNPGRVLDVGAGTGQWGYDVGAVHENALVVGFDLVRPKRGAPERYHAVRGNVLSGLPFRSDSFEFVHQRLLFSGVPVMAWPAAVAELVRVCRGGGWVELVEGATWFEPAGPATRRLAELLLELNRRSGLDTDSVVFRSLDRYLAGAGAARVERQAFELPMGEWAGKVGSLMASDIRALFTRVSPAFSAQLGVPAATCVELVRTAQLEWEELHTTYALAVAWGQKPEGEVEE